MNTTSDASSSRGYSEDVGVVCPRCEYNLRGLPSPRCPECGNEFRWEELRILDEARDSGFFEYSTPANAARCLLHTWWRALKPVSFWNWATPSWPVQTSRILTFASLTVVVTGFSLAFVMMALHFAMLYWYHGGSYSLGLYVRSWLPMYALSSAGGILPCFAGGVVLWALRGTITPSQFHPRQIVRLLVYPTAFLPLLTIAVPARLISTLFVYASRPNADWATLFWWLQPNGHWSPKVHLRMFDVNWFMSGFEWSNPLRITTLCALAAACVTRTLPNSSPAKFARHVGLTILVLLWPVAMVYLGWFVSFTVGAHRYMASERGWLVGAVTGIACILLLLLADLFFGGQALLDLVLAWP